jgi:putative chitinase
MKFNRKIFFDGVRNLFDSVDRKLTPAKVNALEFLLTSFEKDSRWNDYRHISYAFATICPETDWSFDPIQEYGSFGYFERRYGSHTRKGRELGNDAPGEGAKYSGKGYVQLTGESNYEKLEIKLRAKYPQLVADFETRTGQRFDLTDFVHQAKDRQIAFAIMTVGMFDGIYTGKRLSDFINERECDYTNARRIINGLDRCREIAGYARQFQNILQRALIRSVPSELTPENVGNRIDNFVVLPGPLASGPNLPPSVPQVPPETETNAPAQTAPSVSNTSSSNENDTKEQTPENHASSTPENVNAPAPAGFMKKALLWLAGFGIVPPGLDAIIETVKSYATSGELNLAAALSKAAVVAQFVFPYLIYIGIAFIVFWGINQILRQISFLLEMYLAGSRVHNTVCITPHETRTQTATAAAPSEVASASGWRGFLISLLNKKGDISINVANS